MKTIWISAGPDAWPRANRWKREGEPGLVLPPDENPASFIWPVRGYFVALIALDMPIDDVSAIVRELVDAGAVVVSTLFGPQHASRLEVVAHGRHV